MRKHEGNPFSFKHFLRKASQANYRNTGARPKVYSPVRNLDIDKSDGDGVYTGRNPTELPDFVQDHLVIEQCYLNSDSSVSPTIISDVDNLPDFAINSIGIESRGRNGPAGDLPFDLTGSLDKRPAPSAERRHNGLPDNSETINFPLDLPVQGNLVNSGTEERSTSRGDASLPKSLPDFLSDGPIRNCVASQPEVSAAANSNESLDRRVSKLFLFHDSLNFSIDLFIFLFFRF